MKVMLERKGYRYAGLRSDGMHQFEDSFGTIIIVKEAKFVRKDGSVDFCNYGRNIERRAPSVLVSIANS